MQCLRSVQYLRRSSVAVQTQVSHIVPRLPIGSRYISSVSFGSYSRPGHGTGYNASHNTLCNTSFSGSHGAPYNLLHRGPGFMGSIQKRFISDADVLKSLKKTDTKLISRNSTYDSNTKQVIALLKNEEYAKVKRIVTEKRIDINSHDRWENTPLTDAAQRGDVKAVRFLINDMGANVHASCDCPYHKTALHYASEGGHYEVVEVLLKAGAQSNALDSRKYTALDVASNQRIKNLLLANNGTKGELVPVHTQQRLNLPKAGCPNSLKIGRT